MSRKKGITTHFVVIPWKENSDCSGYGKCACARCHCPLAGCGILRKGCCRYGNLPFLRRKSTGRGIVGIICRIRPCRSIIRYRKIRKYRIEYICHHCAGCRQCRSISGILDKERIGQCSIFRNRNRTDGFGDCQLRATFRDDGFLCGNRPICAMTSPCLLARSYRRSRASIFRTNSACASKT